MEVLLLLMGVKRTEWGKLASNSKPMCDSASWCSNPAINIKHGFGMGFQLGPLAPLPKRATTSSISKPEGWAVGWAAAARRSRTPLSSPSPVFLSFH